MTLVGLVLLQVKTNLRNFTFNYSIRKIKETFFRRVIHNYLFSNEKVLQRAIIYTKKEYYNRNILRKVTLILSNAGIRTG